MLPQDFYPCPYLSLYATLFILCHLPLILTDQKDYLSRHTSF